MKVTLSNSNSSFDSTDIPIVVLLVQPLRDNFILHFSSQLCSSLLDKDKSLQIAVLYDFSTLRSVKLPYGIILRPV
jgi:hypothetical protein